MVLIIGGEKRHSQMGLENRGAMGGRDLTWSLTLLVEGSSI